jgi:predicted Zn-dependent protease
MVFYLARAQAGMVFAHYSDYAPGKALQGEEVRGEKLNLTLVPSAPYSDEGIPMRERALIQDGVLQLLFGPTRFCRYLDIEPTGDYWRIRLDNGTVPFDEMKKNCLYPVSFSDFQMDPMDSHFSGEIRLAYLYTDDGVQILTGGSINGSLLEKQGDLVFSTERYTDASYSGPLAIRLKGVSVSGE